MQDFYDIPITLVINFNTQTITTTTNSNQQKLPQEFETQKKITKDAFIEKGSNLVTKKYEIYENRLSAINYNNLKINEVMGLFLILLAINMVLLFAFNVLEENHISNAIPMSMVVSVFLSYMNWLSMKFFKHS